MQAITIIKFINITYPKNVLAILNASSTNIINLNIKESEKDK